MRPVLCFAIMLTAQLASSCKQRCEGEFDCGEGSYCDRVLHRCTIDCFSNDDCRMPVECRANPNNCAPKGLFCSQRGQCIGNAGDRPAPRPPGEVLERPPDGFDLAAGEGLIFVMNHIEMGEHGVGFDLDLDGFIDNVLFAVAPEVNPSINMGVLLGEVLILLEVAGLEEPYDGWDDSVTLKIYGGVDADYPVDRLNNFELPPGREGRCCEFQIDTRWTTTVQDVRQAKVRVPARIENYRLVAPTNFPHYSFDIEFLLTLGPPPFHYINIANSRLELELDSDLSGMRNGILGGGLTANSLAAIENPFCGASGITCPSGDPSSTLLDLTAYLAGPSPDVDIDHDGRECVLSTGGSQAVIDLCCDGAGTAVCTSQDKVCAGDVIESITQDPSDCALSPKLTDGYSTSFLFSAVAARLTAFGTDR